MTGALESVDGFTALAIAVKAATYLASLLAAGSALFAVIVAREGPARRGAALIAAAAVPVALLLTAMRLAVRAAFLGGSVPSAAFDPLLLSIVAQSPLGTSSAVRAAGLVLVLAVLVPGRAGAVAALAGGATVAASFAFVGHSLGEPRAVLGALVAVHVLVAAFWIGAFWPLHAAAGRDPADRAGALAHRFGRQAVWAVSLLFASGLALVVLLTGGREGVLSTAYGQFIVLKLAVVGGLALLAAMNKLSLTPDLLSGRAEAAESLRRSIRWEAAVVLVVLAVTATFTTITGPPDVGTHDTAQPARGFAHALAPAGPEPPDG